MRPLTILGGGPAGLAAGYYAAQKGIPFAILEASGRVGGNAITIRRGDFLFDSGAHRWHDKDPEATRVVKELLGDELQLIHRPSYIFSGRRFADFPLSPLNLARTLGPVTFARAVFDVMVARAGGRKNGDFRSFALHTYGKTLADRFLLGYSEKLWGLPCEKLSPRIAGQRMKGLTLKTFLKEAVHGHRKKTEHLDGSFYYPRHGIGVIADALARACGEPNIRLNSRVTSVRHDGSRITAVGVNGGPEADAGFVISTLPMDRLVAIMNPAPPDEIVSLARSLRYRSIVLVSLFLDKESVGDAATLYFPGTEFPFTRVYEPRNRSAAMSPAGKTSLVAEIPCQIGDAMWIADERETTSLVVRRLAEARLIREAEVIGSSVDKVPLAYPVLEAGFENRIAALEDYLKTFENLAVSGRSGRFAYVHLHDMMVWGRQVVGKIFDKSAKRA